MSSPGLQHYWRPDSGESPDLQVERFDEGFLGLLRPQMNCHGAPRESATKRRFGKGFLSFLSQQVDWLTISGQGAESNVRSSMHHTDF